MQRVSTDPRRSSLYAVRITAEEAKGLRGLGLALAASNDTPQQVKAGDLALLVAMHVTTKELPNWTWQTFWWEPFPTRPLVDPP